MRGQIRMRVRYRILATEWWEYLFMSSDELQQLVDGTGWSIEELRQDGGRYAARMRLV
jgi:hypothetical protein